MTWSQQKRPRSESDTQHQQIHRLLKEKKKKADRAISACRLSLTFEGRRELPKSEQSCAGEMRAAGSEPERDFGVILIPGRFLK